MIEKLGIALTVKPKKQETAYRTVNLDENADSREAGRQKKYDHERSGDEEAAFGRGIQESQCSQEEPDDVKSSTSTEK